jgi:hypothetical protein
MENLHNALALVFMCYILCLHTATSSFSKAKISNKDEHQGDSDTHLCQTCGKTFKSKFGLSLHIKNKHTCMQIYIAAVE